ncbi:RNA polymerase sigma factor [Psidium guajava]|nr:RNA polymerase sigma factor [Psidium guajava]
MEDCGSKKRRIPRTVATLAQKKKRQRMAGNVPLQCYQPCAVEGKDDLNSRNRCCFDGSEKVMKARTAQVSMICDNAGCLDVEKMLRAEKLKHRFGDVILKAKLLLGGKAHAQEKLASRPEIWSGILQQISSVKTELRKELERKREAARADVQSMKRTADFTENLDALKELKRVFGRSPWVMEAFHGARRENPLEKLGLFLKDIHVDEDVEPDPLDREEGEIY